MNQGATEANAGRLQRLSLRRVVGALTLIAAGGFVTLAIVARPFAAVALAGAVLIAAKGLGWLVYLRRHRDDLRRHGYRW